MRKIIFIAICFALSIMANAQNSYDSLNVNNINARINAWGNHFWDPNATIASAHYEFPAGSAKNTIFNTALWIGGQDDNGQLRLAAERYRTNGPDFWTGPLTVDWTASISPAVISQWNRVWKLNRSEIDAFIADWQDNGILDNPVPLNIQQWPAHGDTLLNQSKYLAPFVDVNSNGLYEWQSGDYPLIKGGQAIFFIYNDKGGVHQETMGDPIGVEIHCMVYAFDCVQDIAFQNTIFMNYKFINRSTYRLNNTYLSVFTDFDIGYSTDDYIGCDVARGSFYAYNAVSEDGSGQPWSYGANPPAQAVTVLAGPKMDPDGLDNPNGLCDASINGANFGDAVVDNERLGLNGFVYFNSLTSGVPTYMTSPYTAADYYNYMRVRWLDGTQMRYGGNGHVSSGGNGPPCRFMFPDDSDACNWGTDSQPTPGFPTSAGEWWNEGSAVNVPGDRKGIGMIGPFTFESGAVRELDLAFVTAKADVGGPWASVELMKQYIDSIRTAFVNGEIMSCNANNVSIDCCYGVRTKTLKISPNPTQSDITAIFEVDGIATYSIIDVTGRIIQSGYLDAGNILEINLSGVRSGIYILRIDEAGRSYTGKFIKQ